MLPRSVAGSIVDGVRANGGVLKALSSLATDFLLASTLLSASGNPRAAGELKDDSKGVVVKSLRSHVLVPSPTEDEGNKSSAAGPSAAPCGEDCSEPLPSIQLKLPLLLHPSCTSILSSATSIMFFSGGCVCALPGYTFILILEVFLPSGVHCLPSKSTLLPPLLLCGCPKLHRNC
jgi:hypothetical protein